jgi:hypothetical protein
MAISCGDAGDHGRPPSPARWAAERYVTAKDADLLAVSSRRAKRGCAAFPICHLSLSSSRSLPTWSLSTGSWSGFVDVVADAVVVVVGVLGRGPGAGGARFTASIGLPHCPLDAHARAHGHHLRGR